MASKQANRQAITLKGSTALVTEFFKYAVNTYVHYNQLTFILDISHCWILSILFQREVYPSDDFHMVKKYGQTVLVTQDLALENYLDRLIKFVFYWFKY
jgi:mitotic spindle assembly checkpoint protein MAD2